MVLDAEVVNYQDKGDGARGVAEEAGCVSLVEGKALEEGDETKVGQLTSMRKIMYGFPDLSCLRKGKRERRDKTSGEKMLV